MNLAYVVIQMEDEKSHRAKCDWPIPVGDPSSAPPGSTPPTQPCGSEDRIYRVSKPSQDYWGNSKSEERNVCQRHLGDAWNDKDVDSVVPMDVPTGRPQG